MIVADSVYSTASSWVVPLAFEARVLIDEVHSAVPSYAGILTAVCANEYLQSHSALVDGSLDIASALSFHH